MVLDGEILDRQKGKVLEDLESEQSDFTACCYGARESERDGLLWHTDLLGASLWHGDICIIIVLYGIVIYTPLVEVNQAL